MWGTVGAVGVSAVVAASVAGFVLVVCGAVDSPRGDCGGLRDAVVLQPARLSADSPDPGDERRQCDQHDAGEGPVLLGRGERDPAGLLFGDRGPECGVMVVALGGCPCLVVGAVVQDPQRGPRRGVDRVVAVEPAERAVQRPVRERRQGLRQRVSEPVGVESEGRRLTAGRGSGRLAANETPGSWARWRRSRPTVRVRRAAAARTATSWRREKRAWFVLMNR